MAMHKAQMGINLTQDIVAKSQPKPRLARGTRRPYPARKVMIELLVKAHGIHWAGWYSQESLEDHWDIITSEFFMNRNSREFWRQWRRDPRPDPRLKNKTLRSKGPTS